MNKYNTSIIYTIKCLDNNIKDFYIGSTTDFKQRRGHHHSNCYNENSRKFNYKLYKFIRNNGGWFNFEMKEMMKINCNDKYELHKIEGQMIKYYKPSLNKRVEGRTQKEYENDNKEKIKEKNKKYYQNNKEKISKRKKKYREKNKDKLKERKKEYREKNKERINEKIKCECGCMITRSHIARHKKSKKHINSIININN